MNSKYSKINKFSKHSKLFQNIPQKTNKGKEIKEVIEKSVS